MNGRVALVTGSSRGIGRAIALALARSGADVVINFHSRSNEAQEVEAQIRGLGRRSVAIQADVSVQTETQRLIKETENQIGPVDILVNNAGIARAQPIEEITEKDWDQLIAAMPLLSIWRDLPLGEAAHLIADHL